MFIQLPSHKHRYIQCKFTPNTNAKTQIALSYYENEQIEEEWYKNGKRHRIGAPAYIAYYENKKSEEVWYKNGKRHRIGAPAYITYFENDQIQHMAYFKNGKKYTATVC